MIDLSGLVPVIKYNHLQPIVDHIGFDIKGCWILYFIHPHSLKNRHLQKGTMSLIYASNFTVKLHNVFDTHPYWQVGFLDKIEKTQTIHPYKGLCIKCRQMNTNEVNFGIIGVDTKEEAMMLRLKYPVYNILNQDGTRFRGE
jgi:hypothetical protein